MFNRPLSGRLWPLHSKPYDDELLCAWLIRLSRAYGVEPGRFCAIIWRHPAFRSRDIDKGIYNDILQVLAEHTATPPSRVLDTTLRGYPGYPSWELAHNRRPPWVLSIGLRGGRRQQPWLQYCPYCLQDDADPYFRRHWRLAFVTVCPQHHCRLLECCIACAAPCNLHQVPGDADAITCCYRCRFDARRTQASGLNATADHHRVAQFQTALVAALRRGWCALSPTQSVPTVQYLLVLQQLARLLVTRNRAKERRTRFCQHLGVVYFEPSFPSFQGRAIEVLSVADRFSLMLLLSKWLEGWPDQFVALCAMAKLTITDLRRDLLLKPDWYDEAVGQVARSQFADREFVSSGTASSVAATSVKSHLLL